MKLLIFFCLAVATVASPQNREIREKLTEINWSNVVPMTETPGFWDGRDVKPAELYPREQSRTGRIVGGIDAPPHVLPFQAALFVYLGFIYGLCGGSLVSTTWILTSAHCSPLSSTRVEVILGAHDISFTEPTQQRSSVLPGGYRNHPQYNPSNFNNDISMLNLPNPVMLNGNVGVIPLPGLGRIDDFVGVFGAVSGWGRFSDAPDTSPTLRVTENEIISNAVCTVTFGPSVIVESNMCTSTTGGNGICSGDTGGPLIIFEAGDFVQVGVASFFSGVGCLAGHPAGFTRVTSFRQWIQETSGI